MTKSPRLLITVSQPLRDWLDVEASRLGISVAELIRRILDQHRQA